MSFNEKVKNELCRNVPEPACCAFAEAYGVLLLCHTFTRMEVRINTSHHAFAARLPPLFEKAFGVAFDEQSYGGKTFVFVIRDKEKSERIWTMTGYENTVALHLNNALISDCCCISAFCRGAFLCGGSVTDPAKYYHLEIITPHLPFSRELTALLHECSLEPKQTLRSGVQVLYFKASEAIEDFLTFIGAPVGALGVMEIKVEKSLRNQINRRVNCETGNVTKTVFAASRQRGILEQLLHSPFWEQLSEQMQETAKIRLAYPEDSLSELSARLGIGKSALNHRLRKLESYNSKEQSPKRGT